MTQEEVKELMKPRGIGISKAILLALNKYRDEVTKH